MTKEQLLEAGFNDQQATTILDIYKKSLDGKYVPKYRFDEVNTELKSTREQVAERDKQIGELKQLNGDSEALKTKIEELTRTNKEKDDEYKKALALEKKKNAIKLELLEDHEGKPHDTEMVMGLFDLDKVELDENTGKITKGFKEQRDTIRKEKVFLFEAKPTQKDDPVGWKPKGTNPKDGDGEPGPATSEAYGKSLAAIKLGMMGIKPTNPAE